MRLALEGDCTVAEMATLKDTLHRALTRREATELSFAAVARGDMAFFELLLAARRAFAAHGVALTLRPDLPAHLRTAAAWTGLAGLCQHPACPESPDSRAPRGDTP